jgi:hypothetical protein
MITVTCACGRHLRAKDELAGKLAQCPHCQKKVQIPVAATSPDESAHPNAPEESVVVASVPATKSRTGLLVGGGLLVAVLVGTLIVYLGWFRGKHSLGTESEPAVTATKPTATITASPNPVPASSEKFGTTTISWDTGSDEVGEVYVSVNGGDEKRFSGSLKRGSQEAAWIGPKASFEFRLYAGREHKVILASVLVTRAK